MRAHRGQNLQGYWPRDTVQQICSQGCKQRVLKRHEMPGVQVDLDDGCCILIGSGSACITYKLAGQESQLLAFRSAKTFKNDITAFEDGHSILKVYCMKI